MADEEQPVTRSWGWPLKWMRDEAFWSETASRTISSLIVAVIVFLVAVVFGYLKQPTHRQYIRVISDILILGLCSSIYVIIGRALSKRINEYLMILFGLVGMCFYLVVPLLFDYFVWG